MLRSKLVWVPNNRLSRTHPSSMCAPTRRPTDLLAPLIHQDILGLPVLPIHHRTESKFLHEYITLTQSHMGMALILFI